MSVVLLGWDDSHAAATVDGIHVRVNRYRRRVVWRCEQHGLSINRPGCEHTQALADTPVPDKKKRKPPAMDETTAPSYEDFYPTGPAPDPDDGYAQFYPSTTAPATNNTEQENSK